MLRGRHLPWPCHRAAPGSKRGSTRRRGCLQAGRQAGRLHPPWPPPRSSRLKSIERALGLVLQGGRWARQAGQEGGEREGRVAGRRLPRRWRGDGRPRRRSTQQRSAGRRQPQHAHKAPPAAVRPSRNGLAAAPALYCCAGANPASPPPPVQVVPAICQLSVEAALRGARPQLGDGQLQSRWALGRGGRWGGVGAGEGWALVAQPGALRCGWVASSAPRQHTKPHTQTCIQPQKQCTPPPSRPTCMRIMPAEYESKRSGAPQAQAQGASVAASTGGGARGKFLGITSSSGAAGGCGRGGSMERVCACVECVGAWSVCVCVWVCVCVCGGGEGGVCVCVWERGCARVDHRWPPHSKHNQAPPTRVSGVQHAVLGVEVDARGQVARGAKVDQLDLGAAGVCACVCTECVGRAGHDGGICAYVCGRGVPRPACPPPTRHPPLAHISHTAHLPVRREDDVLGLDVAVHNAQRVQAFQGCRRGRGWREGQGMRVARRACTSAQCAVLQRRRAPRVGSAGPWPRRAAILQRRDLLCKNDGGTLLRAPSTQTRTQPHPQTASSSQP